MTTTALPARLPLARRGGLLFYFFVAYALTWMFWVPAALAARGQLDLPVPGFLLMVLGGLGPMLAAILVSGYASGGAGVRALFGQLLRWRVSLKWYLIALLGIAALELSVIPVRLASGGPVGGGRCSARWAWRRSTSCSSPLSAAAWTRRWAGAGTRFPGSRAAWAR